jgi:hypothetical protein
MYNRLLCCSSRDGLCVFSHHVVMVSTNVSKDKSASHIQSNSVVQLHAQVTGRMKRIFERFRNGLELDSDPQYENSKPLRNPLLHGMKTPPNAIVCKTCPVAVPKIYNASIFPNFVIYSNSHHSDEYVPQAHCTASLVHGNCHCMYRRMMTFHAIQPQCSAQR